MINITAKRSYQLKIPYLFDLPPLALIKFLDLESGRLFGVGVYSRLGAYSNTGKYGIQAMEYTFW